MQKETKWMWPFTRKVTNGDSEQLLSSNPKASPLGKYYQNIHECPLSVFIECACEESVAPLIISGNVAQDKLSESWKSIYMDYADSLISESEQATLIIERRIALLENKIARAYAIRTVLSYQRSVEMETEFLKLGVVDSRFPENINSQESWWKRAIGRIKRWEVELESEQKRMAQLTQSTAAASGKPTRESFQDFIVQVEKYLKFSIRESETTVARFIAMVKDYQRHIIALSKANKK